MVVTGRKEMMLLPMSLHKRQNFLYTFLYEMAQAKQPI